jgi:phospholipid:diacylglycerol acyltransferase
MSDAYQFLLQQTPTTFQKMLESNFSFGIETDPERLIENNQDFRKWTNPLEIQLPHSKNLKIFCLYGVGKPTEVSDIPLRSCIKTVSFFVNELVFLIYVSTCL